MNDGLIDVRVNDEDNRFPDGSTVAEVLDALGTPPRGIAVALDGEVVRRARWADVVVPDGGRLEILTAVQGG